MSQVGMIEMALLGVARGMQPITIAHGMEVGIETSKKWPMKHAVSVEVAHKAGGMELAGVRQTRNAPYAILIVTKMLIVKVH